jgi:hypothetical protein
MAVKLTINSSFTTKLKKMLSEVTLQKMSLPSKRRKRRAIGKENGVKRAKRVMRMSNKIENMDPNEFFDNFELFTAFRFTSNDKELKFDPKNPEKKVRRRLIFDYDCEENQANLIKLDNLKPVQSKTRLRKRHITHNRLSVDISKKQKAEANKGNLSKRIRLGTSLDFFKRAEQEGELKDIEAIKEYLKDVGVMKKKRSEFDKGKAAFNIGKKAVRIENKRTKKNKAFRLGGKKREYQSQNNLLRGMKARRRKGNNPDWLLDNLGKSSGVELM